MVAGLFEWAYGIWPSYGPAVVLASLVISAILCPFTVLEVRAQWRAFAQAGGGDPVLSHQRLFRGGNLLRFLARRALLLGSAVLVLLTVLGWEQRHGEMSFAGVDLGKSLLVLWRAGHRESTVVIPHAVIPAVFVLAYVVAGAKPMAGSRTLHLVGAGLIAVLAPGAVVLYLLTVLLVNAGVVRGMTRAAAFAGSMSARENRGEQRHATRWADYLLPTERWRDGVHALWLGRLECLLGMAATAVGTYHALTALPADPRDLGLGIDTGPLLLGSLLGTAGMVLFARGERYRWMGRLTLSRISAYRHEHGFPERTDSLGALNRSLPRRARGTGVALMAVGGWGACGAGCAGIAVGLRYTWELVAGDGASLSTSLLPLVLGTALMAEGNALLRIGGRHVQRVVSSPEDLVAGSYALYLRSFEEDAKLARLHRVPRPSALVRGFFTPGHPEEERLSDALTWAGLPVSVGRPGERAPHVGAARMYLPLHGWQEPVRQMMRGASLVVLVLGTGAGTLWELGEAMRLLPPQRLLLLVTMPRREYDRCREVVQSGLREQAETVRRETGARWDPPSLPDYAGGPAVASRIRGLIYFTPSWEPVFAPLERPPFLKGRLLGALDRSLWPVAVPLTDHELRTGKRYG